MIISDDSSVAGTFAADLVVRNSTISGAVAVTGNLTLRGTAFAGAYVITCTNLTIDELTWVAALAAGVTFTVSGSTSYLWHGQILSWGALSPVTGQFLPEGTRTTGSASDATEFHVQRYFPEARRAARFRAYAQTSGTLTVRKNGADTALTLSPTGAFLLDSTHTVDFAVGDAISIGITGTVVGNMYASVVLY